MLASLRERSARRCYGQRLDGRGVVRIFIWHGYLLAGTGSNVFARELARQWGQAGHDVTVFSQEPNPGDYDLGGAATVRPDVGGLLPVFVIDRYEGYRVQRVQETSRAELDAWVEANAAAIREHLPADLVVAGHMLLGGPVGTATGARYTVLAHGSELEYSMRGNAELSAWGAETAAGAAAVIVGSEHIRSVVEEVCGPVERVHAVPPGVDIEVWWPHSRADALAALVAEARQDPPNPGNADERLPDENNAERLAEFLADDVPTVVYFGKLIENKGVQVLISALRELGCRAVIVGFGPEREQFERQAEGLRVLFTGPFEHRHLIHLCALADAAVVPSIFPEAFGMVAAEAAAAGCPPIVAQHSGLAEIAQGLERFYPAGKGPLASFPSGDAAALAERLGAILALSGAERDELRAAAREAAVELWSWKSVAERILVASIDPAP
jgi:glycosyltransferase involved in cell wall biosynthesis